MRHLLSGVALATLLLVALPAAAQTNTDQPLAPTTDQDQGATSTKPMRHKLHHGMRSKGSLDNETTQLLNRRELDRINREQTAASPSPVPASPQR